MSIDIRSVRVKFCHDFRSLPFQSHQLDLSALERSSSFCEEYFVRLLTDHLGITRQDGLFWTRIQALQLNIT